MTNAGSTFAPTIDMEFIDGNLYFSSAGALNNSPGNERVGLAIYNEDGSVTSADKDLYTQISLGSNGSVFVGGNSGAGADTNIFGGGNAVSRSRIAELNMDDYSISDPYLLQYLDGKLIDSSTINIKDLSNSMPFLSQAIPEPGTIALIAIAGLGGLGGSRLRKKRLAKKAAV